MMFFHVIGCLETAAAHWMMDMRADETENCVLSSDVKVQRCLQVCGYLASDWSTKIFE